MYRLENGHRKQRFASLKSLEQELDQLHARFASHPTVVTVKRDSTRDSMTIGLGAAFSVMNYIPADIDSESCLMSVDRARRFVAASRLVSFRFGGEVSEFSSRNAIPMEVARVVLSEFCRDGVLSKKVDWEQP